MLKRILVLALLGPLLTPGQAAEPARKLTTETIIKRTLEGRLGGAKVEAVVKTPYLGLYEARIDGRILYVDEKMNYFFSGDVIDARSMQNLTEKRLRELTAIKWDSLPLDGAFKTVRGNGKRVLAVFSDPNCPYCKRFEKELAKLDDITIHTFLYPILSQDSHDKSIAVWCSADKSRAWSELMLNNKLPSAAGCDTPIDKTLEFARRNRIDSTPTLIFASGERLAGAVSAERLETMLLQSQKK